MRTRIGRHDYPVTVCDELERRARARLDPRVFDYYAGGAGDERTLADNRRAWARLALRPAIGRAADRMPGRAADRAPDTSLTLLGRRLGIPLLLAPVAAQRLLDPAGELASARAAARAGTVYCLSTRATADVAEVAEAAPDAARWFQLYVDRERDRSERALRRLAELGYGAVVLTADLPVAGRRERELRRGPVPLPRGVGIVTHGEPPARPLAGPAGRMVAGTGTGSPTHKPLVGGWDPALTWSDVEWVAGRSRLPVLVKGLLTAEDAALAVEHGAAGVVVSNHGGRQLDGVLPSAVALPEVVAAVAGRIPVLVDGGLRTGADVARALALGAAAAMIGRPYAWALAAGGEDEVVWLLQRLRTELGQAMSACGAATVTDLGPEVLAADR
jgi:4-hydroxymandelate oxidase